MYFSHPSERKDKYDSRDPSNQSSYSYDVKFDRRGNCYGARVISRLGAVWNFMKI